LGRLHLCRGRKPIYAIPEEKIAAAHQKEKQWREAHKEELSIKRIAERNIPRLRAKIPMYINLINQWNDHNPSRAIYVQQEDVSATFDDTSDDDI
jgi:hypothetical protein